MRKCSMRVVLFGLTAVQLIGCATHSPQELAFQKAQRDGYCKQYATPGSPEFEGCHQTIERAERQKRAAAIGEALDDLAEAQARNRPITTNCNRVGSSVNCTTR